MTTLDERLAEIRAAIDGLIDDWCDPRNGEASIQGLKGMMLDVFADSAPWTELERAEERIRVLTNMSDAAERLVAIGEAWTPVDGITVDGEFNSCNVCGASFFEEDDHNAGCAYMDLVTVVLALAGEPPAPPVAQEET